MVFSFWEKVFVKSNKEEHLNEIVVKRGMITYGSHFTAWVERNLSRSYRVYIWLINEGEWNKPFKTIFQKYPKEEWSMLHIVFSSGIVGQILAKKSVYFILFLFRFFSDFSIAWILILLISRSPMKTRETKNSFSGPVTIGTLEKGAPYPFFNHLPVNR